MNNTSIYKLKNISLSLSMTILTTCLVIPLGVNADTSSSVDAIMEQLKALKTQAPKVSAPTPEPEKTKTEEKPVVVSAPVKVEEKIKEKEGDAKKIMSVETVPEKKEDVEKKKAMTVDNSAVIIPETIKAVAPVKVRKPKRRTKKKVINRDYKAFDKDYMSLINQIMNEQSQSEQPARVVAQSGKGVVSGWIYLGRYTAGKWEISNTLNSGNILPQAGQRYTVKSTHLNLRKSRPLNSGLGELVKVLRAGEKVSVLKIYRSSRNNYWANITRP